MIDEIERPLEVAGRETAPTGATVSRDHLVEETRGELLRGYFDERRFEELVRDVVLALGAAEAHVIPRCDR